ncbi:MAG: hypothetical protein IT494_04660 [Gammaproteobacteria bacterium]|nr:hypothetical protein [Gammaproteobacteria bacterium]
MKIRYVSLAWLAISLAAVADDARLNFVSCPIVQDTPTVPCWLADYHGERYYLGIQTDVSAEFQPPYLGHQVLVEGVVTNRPRICGGIVLEPVKISVLPELDRSCNTRLPIDPRYTIDFNPRPPGPSLGRLAFADAQPPGPQPVKPPFVTKEFTVFFDFDQGITFRHPRDLMNIVHYAQETRAKNLTVTGYRGAMKLSDGTVLSESEAIAEKRARQLAELLAGAGVTAAMKTSWQAEPVPADGIDDWQSRSAKVVVTP